MYMCATLGTLSAASFGREVLNTQIKIIAEIKFEYEIKMKRAVDLYTVLRHDIIRGAVCQMAVTVSPDRLNRMHFWQIANSNG